MPAYSLGTMGAWAVTSHTDQIITGAKTFQAAAISVVPLTIKAMPGQTSNLQEWKDSSGTTHAYITTAGAIGSTGNIYANNDVSARQIYAQGQAVTSQQYYGARINVTTDDAARRGMVIRGAASQTANLAEFHKSDGANVLRVTPNGNLDLVSNQSSSAAGIVGSAAHNSLNLYQATDGGGYGHGFLSLGHYTSGRSIQIGFQSGSTYTASTFIPSMIFNDNGVKVMKMAPGQTGNGFEVQNSAGTTMFGVDSTGRPIILGAITYSTANNASGGQYLGNMYANFFAITINGVQYKVPYLAN